MRRALQNPPFADIAVVTFTGQDEARVLRGAVKFRESLNTLLRDPQYDAQQRTVLGPAPCVIPKINYNFRYRLTLRCHLNPAIRALLGHLLRQFSQDRENRGVSAFVDVNGYE